MNWHHNFMAGMHSDFLMEQKDKFLFYWHTHSGKSQLSKQEVEEVKKHCFDQSTLS